jgi:N-acetylmuramoyl-L-alanine amidase
LKERYRIPTSNFLGHGDVAPGRKVDPSRYFPWERLASQGFGLWCDEPALTQRPDPSDPLVALQAIGYDLTDPAAALAAFRRHYLGIDAEGEASEAERRLLQCLVIAKRQKPAP